MLNLLHIFLLLFTLIATSEGWIRTCNISELRQVFYHCAADVNQSLFIGHVGVPLLKAPKSILSFLLIEVHLIFCRNMVPYCFGSRAVDITNRTFFAFIHSHSQQQ